MKKILLLAAIICCALTSGAQQPYERSGTATTSQIKQLNQRPHFQNDRVAKAPTKAAAEAPENAIEVPFTHGLGKDSDKLDIVKQYTIINVNGDSRAWKTGLTNGYGSCMAPNESNIDANDDWLITVPVHMLPGKYVVSFDLGYLSGTGVTLEVKLGNAPTVEGMIAEIAPAKIYDVKDMTTYEYNCAIPTEGYYYFGFHSLTTKEQKSATKLTNISVREGSVEVVQPVDPPAAGELSWILAPKGELKATVTYVAPVKTKSGADLDEISKVEITSQWGADKFTYTDVKPGQTIVVENVDMLAGYNNRFTAVAYKGESAGEMVEYKNIFCGPDVPFAPTDVKLVASPDFKSATLSWTAPGEIGENGGYVDPEDLIYYVFDAFGSYYDPAIASTDKTSIVLEYPDLDGQDFVAYQVTAEYKGNYSLDCASNILTIGQPSALPFTESFSDGRYDGLWLINPDTNGYQNYGTVDDSYFPGLIDPDDPDAPAPLQSHDADNGFYYWMPVDKDSMFGLVSVRADISKAANPVLEFWYQGHGSTIDVLLAAGSDNFTTVGTIDLQASPANEWTMARIPLSAYKDAGSVQFEIRLTANHNDDEHIWSVPIDDISIRDLVDIDMHMMSANIPSETKVGDVLTIGANMKNFGTKTTTAVAEFYIDGVKVEEKSIVALAPYATTNTTFNYTVPMDASEKLDVEIRVVADGDACAINNTATGSVTVKFPKYPSVTGLTATPSADGSSVQLAWTAPDINALKGPSIINEDFESETYTPMSISGAGGWTVYDGDKVKTYNVFRELYNNYQIQPMAFQLFNRVIAMVPDEYWLDAEPHSGSTFMMAPSAQRALNDNWLISPQLSGNAQTVTFWAKSFSIAWPESFEVYYSITGNTVECFTEVLKVENYPADGAVPEEWTEFKVALPEGARYFAIHHTSYDSVALMVDDVTYEGMPDIPEDLTLTGYHVFWNGTQVTDNIIAETSYTHNIPTGRATDGNVHKYSVVAVYNHGCAQGSAIEVTTSSTGITDITVENIGSDDKVYNLGGLQVDHSKITPGIYIVVRDGKAVKAAVR